MQVIFEKNDEKYQRRIAQHLQLSYEELQALDYSIEHEFIGGSYYGYNQVLTYIKFKIELTQEYKDRLGLNHSLNWRVLPSELMEGL